MAAHHRQNGRKGGQATLEKHGKAHFETIGSMDHPRKPKFEDTLERNWAQWEYQQRQSQGRNSM